MNAPNSSYFPIETSNIPRIAHVDVAKRRARGMRRSSMGEA